MLAVIALDAADHRLATEWGCENILLDRHRELESFAHSGAYPLTLEVWTSVATGLHPREHGIESTGRHQSWTDPVLAGASRVAPYLLPKSLRVTLGTLLRGDDGDSMMTFSTTDAPHPFPEGCVYGWPGITDGLHLSQTWHWLRLASEGRITDAELWRRLWGNAGRELGWVLGMNQTACQVVGVHMHVLDAAGHSFANHESRLREVYERVDAMLGIVRKQVDAMLVLSDHGMQVGWIPGDDSPGDHSWRALAATTLDAEPPADVFAVREWIASNAATASQDERDAVMDTTREQLEDLGYL